MQRILRVLLACLCAALVVPSAVASAGPFGPVPPTPVAPTWSIIAGHIVEASAATVSRDGNHVFVAGPARIGSRYASSITSYDARSGELEWRFRSRRTTADPHPCALGISPDGSTLFLLGHTDAVGTGVDVGVWALHARTGANRWSARHDGAAHARDLAHAIVVGPSGRRVYVTGTSRSRGLRGDDLLVLAYDARNGAVLWRRVVDGGYRGCLPSDGCYSGFEHGYTLTLSDDGATLIAGGVQRLTSLVVAFRSASGERRWLRTYQDPAAAGADAAHRWSAAAVAGDRLFVGGGAATDEAGEPRPVAASYDVTTGRRAWVATYQPDGLRSGSWASVQVVEDAVFTAGAVRTTLDRFTVASYDADTGSLRWRFEDAEAGGSSALGVHDRIYAAGHRDSGADSDLTVVGLDPASGMATWIGRHVAATGGWERTHALAIASDGASIFAVGSTGSTFDDRSALITAFTALT